MTTPLTELADQYAVAPRNHTEFAELAINAGVAADITPLLPTQADLGEAPCFDLMVAFNSIAHNEGLIGVAVTDDVAVQDITHPYEGPNNAFDGIIVRGLLPFDAADGNNLAVPLPWVTTQRVYIVNLTAGQVTVGFGARMPTLDWD